MMEKNQENHRKIIPRSIKAWISSHIVLTIFICTAVVAIAAGISHFAFQEQTGVVKGSDWVKLVEMPSPAEITLTPGDSAAGTAGQKVISDSTFTTYAIYEFSCSSYDGSPIYSITPGDDWTQISCSPDGVIVFGYGTADVLTEIDMEGSTSQLINTITLTDKLPNIEYKSMAENDELNYKIRAWLVASEECGSSDPDVVYSMIKDLR